MKDVRTWIEIDAKVLRKNAEQFLRLIPPGTRLMAVIKSNAYGHGLVMVAKELAELRSTNIPDLVPLGGTKSGMEQLWFGVDSITEALRLRREGIKNPILVLGFTLPSRLGEAAEKGIALTVSNTGALKAIGTLTRRPPVHIKIDTGMHRQGFFPAEMPHIIRLLTRFKIKPEGICTHFASAKDPRDPRYTLKQLSVFRDVTSEMERAGYGGMIRHAAASGGTILFPESRLDMVRVGMGLYGYWPSPESRDTRHITRNTEISLKLALTWKTIVSEVKSIPKGALVGYDGTERVGRPTRIAVLPVGYWHGIDRGLSQIGDVVIRGRKAKMLGRISMDMTVVDVTDIPGVKPGDGAILIGGRGKKAISADAIAEKIQTTAYEILTRINPLIRRTIIHDE